MKVDKSINVFAEPLLPYGENPVAGFFRDGKCNTCDEGFGSHTVCIETTKKFLEYSRFKGNDPSTPMPGYGFEGLKPGNTWCLCAKRWLESYEDNMAPRVHLTKTHQCALEIIPLEILRKFAADLN